MRTPVASPVQRPVNPDGFADGELLATVASAGPEAAGAYRQLVERHLPSVVRVGRRMLGNPTEADDVAQEAMLRLWRNAGSIGVPPSGLGGWLYRVTSNLSLDRLRARRPEGSDGLDELNVEPDQFDAMARKDLAAKVEAALQTLPERQRLALTLCHYEGLTMQEAGAIMEASEEGIESLLARARRSLRTKLQSEWRDLLPSTGES